MRSFLVKNDPVKPIRQTSPTPLNASEGPLTNAQLRPIPSKLAASSSALLFGGRKLHIFEPATKWVGNGRSRFVRARIGAIVVRV